MPTPSFGCSRTKRRSWKMQLQLMMMPSSFMRWVLCFILLNAIAVQKIQCTEGYNTYDELKSGNSLELKIQNTDCHLQGKAGQSNCLTKFTKQSGSCPFSQAVSQLFPSLNLKEITKGFVRTEKFTMEEVIVDTCDSKEAVKFKLKTTESYDVVPKYIVLAADSKCNLEWDNKGSELKLEDIKMVFDGTTSIGKDHGVKIKIEKSLQRDDYEISCVVGTVSIRDFLAKFDIDANDMKPMQAPDSAAIFSDEMRAEHQALSINTLNFQNPTIKGVFSQGAGFEITVKGTQGAPKLISEAKAAYLIVQDFKKPDADVPADAETFDVPAAALFCSYDSDTVSGIVYSLTGHMVPPHMALIKDINNVAITAATKNINFVNTPDLRELVEEFTPAKGLDMIEKGLNVLHFTSAGSVAAQDEDKQTMSKVLFRIKILPKKIEWKTPQVIQGTMKEMAAMVWPKVNGIDRFPIQASTKVIYDSIYYSKKNKALNVKFNLTEKIDVLEGGLVSLLNTSMKVYSTRKDNGKYRKWKLVGSGQESILDELVDIKVKSDDEDKIYVESKEANIFSMTDIRNRTQATYLSEDYENIFNASLNFAIKDVHYRASFDEREFLRFVGKVDLTENTEIEILYAASATSPKLKVGIYFKDHWLHETVNVLYQKDAMQIVWMKFDDIGVVFKKEEFGAVFANEMLKQADGIIDSGISTVANSLQLDNCGEAKLCLFLKERYGDRFNVLFKGQALKEKHMMRVRVPDIVKIGEGVDLTDIVARIVSNIGEGDRVSLGGDVAFRSTGEKFKGSVYDDGSDKLMLKAGDHKQGSKDMFSLPYVEMKPMDILFEIPTGYVEIMEFKSRLFIGQPEDKQIEFSGGISRQYVGLKDASYLRFFAAKTNTPLRNIYASFGIQEPQSLIKGAKFDDSYVVAYNSMNEAWKIPEVDDKFKKGFYYRGKIALKSGDKLLADMKLGDALEIETKVRLPPVVLGEVDTKEIKAKYGSEVITEEKISHTNVSLAMYKSEKNTDNGPVIVVQSDGKQKIKGYIHTIGLDTSFEMNIEMKGKKDFISNVELDGKIFNEVKGKIKLTSTGSGFPVEIIDKLMRLSINTPTRQALTEFLRPVKKPPWKPQVTWVSTITQDLKHLGLTFSEAQTLAQDRKKWKALVRKVRNVESQQ